MDRTPEYRLEANRVNTVDLLRGLSIIAVVLLHIDIRIPFAKSALGAHFSRNVISAVFRSGHYGVKIFFVVSGFLITTTILRRWGTLEKIDWRAFYGLRFARIAPCLLALLCILCLLHLAGVRGFTIDPRQTTLLPALLAVLTFHFNQFEIKIGYLPGNWDVLWSLSVEEAFYLVYPMLCRFAPNRFLLWGIGTCLVVIGPFSRTILASNERAEDYSYLAGFDCIAFGCAAALAGNMVKVAGIKRWTVQTAGWALLLLVMAFRQQASQLRLGATGLDVTVLAIGTALILFSAHQRDFGSPLTAPIRWFGRNSYEIYLIHMFVIVWGVQVFHQAKSSANSASFWHLGLLTISGVLGSVIAWCYSEPLNRKLRARMVLRKTELQ